MFTTGLASGQLLLPRLHQPGDLTSFRISIVISNFSKNLLLFEKGDPAMVGGENSRVPGSPSLGRTLDRHE